MIRSRSAGGQRRSCVLAVVLGAILAALAGATDARPSGRSDSITISALVNLATKSGYEVLIPNFERVYPNIKVNPVYAPTTNFQYQLTTTELAAGNAPEVVALWPGCGTSISVCRIAKAGYVAPLVKKPWTRWSVPIVLSSSKYGAGLFTFSQVLTFMGLWTNDAWFSRLGLKVPQTFPQLLDVCQKAKAAGVGTPMLLPLSNSLVMQQLASDLALTTVYAKDANWAKKLRARKVTFAGTAGWRVALQELVDLKNAGCIQAGVAAGTTSPSAATQFGQGKALMLANLSSWKGTIAAADPQFAYSQHPFPNASTAGRTVVFVNMGQGVSVNAHASARGQSAAQAFVDFLARPKQDALFAELNGGVTQFQFQRGELPSYAASFGPLLKRKAWAVNPVETWWNATTGDALITYGTGVLTGQYSVDDALKAMDNAWKIGPDNR